jgi:hypothetical protein
MGLKRFNEWLAVKITRHVATMECAYAFAALALMALPQAIHDARTEGALPLVTWASQSFIQLVLLSIIMVGQDIQSRRSEERAEQDHAALCQILADLHAKHDALHDKI